MNMESIEFKVEDFKDKKFWDNFFKDLHTNAISWS
jgi:hypothetical protein